MLFVVQGEIPIRPAVTAFAQRAYPIVGMTNSAPSLTPRRPARGDRLGLGVEADRIRPVLVEVAEARALPAAEGVIGDRHRDRHVDADHADLHPGDEIARRIAVAGEDRDAVAVFVVVGQRERFIVVLSARTTESTGPKISSL